MTPENLTRLRELASAARIEWRVADPATKAYCMSYDRSDTLTPEEDAHAWLEDQRKRCPNSCFAHYEVICVEVRTELQRLAGELLAKAERLNTPGDPYLLAQLHAQCKHLLDDLTTTTHDKHGLAEHSPVASLTYSNFIGALVPVVAQAGAAIAAPHRITPNLEALQERLLAPTTISRDELGHYWHPHLPDCDEHIHYGTLLAAFHIQLVTVAMEADAPDLAERYFEDDEPDLRAWTPTPPPGEGWVLLAIHDLEDGPCAWFGHHITPGERHGRTRDNLPIELSGIRHQVEHKESGFWRSCSGCHESNEGHPTGPWSVTMRCHLGNGCSECGGIGAIWDNTDYQAMADDLANAIDTPPGFIKPDTHSAVYFYEQDFYVLSNFSAFTLQRHGLRFDTSEAAYHFEKFKTGEGCATIRAAILSAPSAHQAFKIAERHKEQRRPDWDQVKVQIMRSILRAKVDQHEYVRRKLLATGERELVEDSWRDPFWGWGPNRDGQNMLGKLWMEIRAELRAQEPGNA